MHGSFGPRQVLSPSGASNRSTESGGGGLAATAPEPAPRKPDRLFPPRLLRTIVLPLLAAFTALLNGSCGLETVPYLAPPTGITYDVAGVWAAFTNDPANNVDYFSGYEVYYKLYLQTGDAASDQNAIQTSTAPGISLLTSLGYRRLVPGTQTFNGQPRIPLIPFSSAEKSQALQVKLNFLFSSVPPPTQDATAVWSGVNSPVDLKRNANAPAANPTSQYKSFFSNEYVSTDGDLPSGYSGTSNLYIVLVVLAYGTDLNTFQPIYSLPTLLVSSSSIVSFVIPVSTPFPTQ